MIPQNKIMDFIDEIYQDFRHVRTEKWNYEDACLLLAAVQLYEATDHPKFKDFVLKYVDSYILPSGEIKTYQLEDYNLDNIAMGRVLFFAYEQTKEKRYYQAIEILYQQLNNQPRAKNGNFWHKKIYKNQIWLDGLFMAQPFYIAWETKFGKKEHYTDIMEQFSNVRKYMYDQEKKLYYHGFDESKEIFWADKNTGCSKNFWLRAIAWYHIALVDTIEEMSIQLYEHYDTLSSLYKEGIKGVLQYQDSRSKLFYQIVNEPEAKGNYLETSGSAMLAASIFKACRLKVLSKDKYFNVGEEILEALINQKLCKEKDGYVLKDTCLVAGLGPEDNARRDGSLSYYFSEPKKDNDLKGVAALFMAYAQYLKLL